MVTPRETVCLLWHVHDVFKYMGDCSVCLLSNVADNDVFKYMGDCSVCLLSDVADNDVFKYMGDCSVCLLSDVADNDVFKYMGDCSVCLLSDVADNDVFKYMGDCSVCLLSDVADNDVFKYMGDCSVCPGKYCLMWLIMISVNMWKTVCLLSAVVFSLNHAHSVFHYWFGGMFLLQRSWRWIVCTPRTAVTPWSDKRCPSHGSPVTWLMCPSPRHSPLLIILRWKTTTVFCVFFFFFWNEPLMKDHLSFFLFFTISFSETLPFAFPGKWTPGTKFPLGWWSTTTKNCQQTSRILPSTGPLDHSFLGVMF